MARVLHAFALGIIGAGIVHIIVLLLVPTYSPRDAWAILSEQANFYHPVHLNPPQATPLIGSPDPLFDAVACRFDLRDGVMRLHGEGSTPYWSMSVHDRAGLNIFSVNDSSSPPGLLDFVIATPAQMIGLRNAMRQELASAIFIETDIDEGIAVIRTFVPDASWKPGIATWLQNISCTPS